MTELVKILAKGLDFPKGAAFDHQGNLWCLELKGGNLVRWSEAGIERYPAGGAPSGLAFDQSGRAWICDAGNNAIRRFNPQSGTWETIIDTLNGEPLNRPNDLAFDMAGNLVFSCPGISDDEPDGCVCCLRPDGILTTIAEQMYCPTGLAFLAQGRQLVIAETNRRRLWVGAWDAQAAAWKNSAPWAELDDQTRPGGIGIGDDGLLYVASIHAGQILVIDTDGRSSTAYDVPGAFPTSAAFDPNPGCPLGLVVTEAEQGLLLSLPHLGPGLRLGDGGDQWP